MQTIRGNTSSYVQNDPPPHSHGAVRKGWGLDVGTMHHSAAASVCAPLLAAMCVNGAHTLPAHKNVTNIMQHKLASSASETLMFDTSMKIWGDFSIHTNTVYMLLCVELFFVFEEMCLIATKRTPESLCYRHFEQD